ncbi:hypothetical protein F3Y22_tig00110904pilonHSYRG00013 [Hibiscus syriacus]|uniref:Disease resistance R13L4/SHOC-2-like LRR domain-containing protein n=1 Tax=Hibiscus syriacus TaxID=106335 RepID=A0A6A2ZDX1_HIBSY|nr:hypothetical protein F3Y22_tig00110904pilonHSYRG00013 [Hibiscus syriacus]
MGFIEPATKKSVPLVTSYRMHPIIRCLVIRLAKEANFFSFYPKGYPDKNFFKGKKICLVKSQGPSWWSKKLPLPKEFDPNAEQKQTAEAEEKRSVELEKKKAQAGEKKRVKREKKKAQGEEEKKRVAYLEKLETLFNVSKQFLNLPEELFSKMKKIRVLYLGSWMCSAEHHIQVGNKDFLRGLKNMNKLRFLSLQGISGISKLRGCLAKLQNLRVLDLRACHNLEKLPREVGSLNKLAYLDLSECFLLNNIPKQLSQLSDLKVLEGFVISRKSPCTLDDLKKLKHLVKLSINVNDYDLLHPEATTFSMFENLQNLKIAWIGARVDKSQVDGKKDAIKDTKKQASAWGACAIKYTKKQKQASAIKYTKQQASDAPSSKPEMKKLIKLELQCYPGREPPQWLVPETLECLERLYIRGGALTSLGQIDKKWKVKILRLKYLASIKMNWKELQIQFPKLEYLEKVNCHQIAFCPCDSSGLWQKDSNQT